MSTEEDARTASDGGTVVATELRDATLGTQGAFEVLADVDKLPGAAGEVRGGTAGTGAWLAPVKALLPHSTAGTTGHMHETQQLPKCAFEPRSSEWPKTVEPLTKY